MFGPASLRALDVARSPYTAPPTGGALHTDPSVPLRAPTQSERDAPAPAGSAKAGDLADQARATGRVQVPESPASGSLSERIVANANADEGRVEPGGRDYKGWQYLRSVFEKTTGWRPDDATIRSDSTPNGKNGCGIWAAHTLNKSGVDVRWDLNQGRMVGDVDLVTSYGKSWAGDRQGFEGSVKSGDVILLKGSLNHHAVVTGVNADGT